MYGKVLNKLATSTAEIENDFIADHENEATRWANALAKQCRSALDELTFLAPWVILPDSPDQKNYFPGTDEIPTLRRTSKT